MPTRSTQGITHRLPIRLRSLATAEVAQGPGGISKHAQLAAVAQEGQKWSQGTRLQNKVAARRAVTGDIAQSPHCLLSNVGFRAGEKFDEYGHSSGLDDNLRLLCGSGSDVRKSPCCLKLNKGMRRTKEFDESAYDAGFDDPLDRGVALLGQQFSELCSSLDLVVDLIGEDSFDHFRKFFIELKRSALVPIAVG